MLHTDTSEGKKGKPRGRPFKKGNVKGMVNDEILAASGHESSVKGKNLIDNTQTIEKESSIPEIEKKELELIDSIEFRNGKNFLTIRFSKRHNRMYRIQIFLNDEFEVRPVTYTGASTGQTFWNLLKGSLNSEKNHGDKL